MKTPSEKLLRIALLIVCGFMMMIHYSLSSVDFYHSMIVFSICIISFLLFTPFVNNKYEKEYLFIHIPASCFIACLINPSFIWLIVLSSVAGFLVQDAVKNCAMIVYRNISSGISKARLTEIYKSLARFPYHNH